MTRSNNPDKRKVRAYMEDRTHPEQDDSPPMPDDIRRELGWDLIPHNNHTEDQP